MVLCPTLPFGYFGTFRSHTGWFNISLLAPCCGVLSRIGFGTTVRQTPSRLVCAILRPPALGRFRHKQTPQEKKRRSPVGIEPGKRGRVNTLLKRKKNRSSILSVSFSKTRAAAIQRTDIARKIHWFRVEKEKEKEHKRKHTNTQYVYSMYIYIYILPRTTRSLPSEIFMGIHRHQAVVLLLHPTLERPLRCVGKVPLVVRRLKQAL